MSNWYMLTLVGSDRKGIVAAVTQALYKAGCTLGEASMLRLGGNFTIMMMVSGKNPEALQTTLQPVAEAMRLHLHLDTIEGELHQHLVPNMRIRVSGADRPGIIAQVTGALAAAGLNILELESDVAGQSSAPVYIMNIEGYSERTVEALEAALEQISSDDLDVDVYPIDTLIG
jgi:glycine cleavage system transcriptional repressor